MRHHPDRLFGIITIAALLIANGCTRSTRLVQPVTARPAPVVTITKSTVALEADRLVVDGDFQKAALAYQRLANRGDNQQQTYLRKAVSAWIKAEKLGKAETLFKTLATPISQQDRYHKQLLAAELALAKGHTDKALALLVFPINKLSVALQAQYYLLRGQALQQQGKSLRSAYTLMRADALLTNRRQAEQNQAQILQTLLSVPNQRLKAKIAPPPDPIGGWMALAQIVQLYQADPSQGKTRLASWRRSYNAHPARSSVIDIYTRDFSRKYPQARQIALLLPATGPYAVPSQALRNGFLASYLAVQNQQRPTIRFYNSGEPSRIGEVYHKAVAEGADLIIGPLRKEAVVALVRTVELSVPVLALNRLPSKAPAPPELLYQFALAPEEEAHQVAQLATKDGHRRALILVPKGSWGQRVSQAFQQRWRQLGGSVALRISYPPSKRDFSDVLQRLLAGNIKPSSQNGADFLFLAAHPREARLIRPELQFQHAGHLPIYATSHIYSGVHNPQSDGKLNGILFCDLPWLLTSNQHGVLRVRDTYQLWPKQDERFVRLYALGMDSFQLSGQLAYLKDHPKQSLSANTGMLSMQANRQIRRRLTWARFQGGTPQPLKAAPVIRRLPSNSSRQRTRHL